MKCPRCGMKLVRNESVVSRVFEDGFCDECLGCGKTFNQRDPFDPTELLDLVEKVKGDAPFGYENKACYYEMAMDHIVRFLSGDPSALKKLAGVE